MPCWQHAPQQETLNSPLIPRDEKQDCRNSAHFMLIRHAVLGNVPLFKGDILVEKG